ncbi:VirK family protein [Sphingomonas sp.]|uniref:VirK family protein n=1 Tax=Sphingomonas sp. TaxID=28214 RepID=UPI003B3A25C3
MAVTPRLVVPLLAALLAGRADAAVPAPSLGAVERALENGRSVTVLLDLSQCHPGSTDSKPTRTRGGLRIDAFRIGDDGSLAFSDDHFTIDRDGKPIQQFLRYRIHQDGSADFSMTVFSVPDFRQIRATLSYKCAVNRGMRFVASRR